MKVIFKITKYLPETNQIAVKFCNLKSKISIDDYVSIGLSCDDLDMNDIESFSESLVNKFGLNQIENQENKLDVIPSNIPVDISGDLNLRDLIGKIICVKKFNRKIQKLHMRRIEL